MKGASDRKVLQYGSVSEVEIAAVDPFLSSKAVSQGSCILDRCNLSNAAGDKINRLLNKFFKKLLEGARNQNLTESSKKYENKGYSPIDFCSANYTAYTASETFASWAHLCSLKKFSAPRGHVCSVLFSHTLELDVGNQRLKPMDSNWKSPSSYFAEYCYSLYPT